MKQLNFKKGNRVQFSKVAFVKNITKRQITGTVTHAPRIHSVSVLWDDRTSVSSYHYTFLKKILRAKTLHFARNVSTAKIKRRIKTLTNHKVVKEIDLLLSELRRRKIHFQFRIFSEMLKKN